VLFLIDKAPGGLMQHLKPLRIKSSGAGGNSGQLNAVVMVVVSDRNSTCNRHQRAGHERLKMIH